MGQTIVVIFMCVVAVGGAFFSWWLENGKTTPDDKSGQTEEKSKEAK